MKLINHNVVKIDTYRDINDTFELFLIIAFEYSNALNFIILNWNPQQHNI